MLNAVYDMPDDLRAVTEDLFRSFSGLGIFQEQLRDIILQDIEMIRVVGPMAASVTRVSIPLSAAIFLSYALSERKEFVSERIAYTSIRALNAAQEKSIKFFDELSLDIIAARAQYKKDSYENRFLAMVSFHLDYRKHLVNLNYPLDKTLDYLEEISATPVLRDVLAIYLEQKKMPPIDVLKEVVDAYGHTA